MRRFIVTVALAALVFIPGAAFAQSPAESPSTALTPTAPAPAPTAPAAQAAAIAPKRETVTEYVLYLGAFDDEGKKPLFSDQDLDLVKFHRNDELRKALGAGYARPVYSIGRRQCSYPLGPKGQKLAMGSTCDESEVV